MCKRNNIAVKYDIYSKLLFEFSDLDLPRELSIILIIFLSKSLITAFSF